LKGQSGNVANEAPVDEAHAQRSHAEAYSKNNAGGLDAHSMGTAAAMQALKRFTGGGSGGEAASSSSGGGDMQSKLIGMAMSEAASLFNQSGGPSDGGAKSEVVQAAGKAMMKLVVQNQMKSFIGGGDKGGGLGGMGSMMGLASKLL